VVEGNNIPIKSCEARTVGDGEAKQVNAGKLFRACAGESKPGFIKDAERIGPEDMT